MAQVKICDICNQQDAKTYSFGCRTHGFWKVDLCPYHASDALTVLLKYNDAHLSISTVPKIKEVLGVRSVKY